MSALIVRLRAARPAFHDRSGKALDRQGPGPAYMDSVKFKPGLLNVCRPGSAGGAAWPSAPDAGGAGVALHWPDPAANSPLHALMLARKSERRHAPLAMTVAELAELVLYSSGPNPLRAGRRPAPSGGSTFPVMLCCAALNVDGVAPGYYRFDPDTEQLLPCQAHFQGIHEEMRRFFHPHAGLLVFLCLDLARVYPQYGALAYKLGMIEAGHIAQNILLMCAARGLQACPLLHFPDDRVNAELALDGSARAVIYAIEIGTSAAASA